MTEFLRTWAEIDLDALVRNFQTAKSRLKDKKITAVVKANAYGHGAVQVAKAICAQTDCFAVATLEEALELRKNGIENDIMILSPVPRAQFLSAAKADIMTVLFYDDDAKALSEAARSLGKVARAYLAVDTGMSRIGLSCDASGIDEAIKICSHEWVNVCGILTHYACADGKDDRVTARQTERFDAFFASLENSGIHIPVRSASNTAKTINSDEKYEMARVGIALYGMYPSDHVNKANFPVEPVMSLKTKITQIKTVPQGTGVSYGHTFITEKPMKIATLAIGYADGIPLSLSGRGKVIICGKFAPILGRVCMDQMMVDVSDIDDAKVGGTAVIFGKDRKAQITVDEVAQTAGTINYDIVCRLDCRVPRVFIRGGAVTEIFSYII